MKTLLLRLNQRLPKLWLFSIYGAVGGLLGALLLGELLFALLTPRKVERKPPAVQMAVPASVSVYMGGKNRVPIKVAREFGFTGPVTVKATSHLKNISLDDITIPAEETTGEATLSAGEMASDGEREIELTAVGDAPSGRVESKATLALTVMKPPPALRLTLSPAVVVEQQGKNLFMVNIARDNFKGPVELRFSALPNGATIPKTVIPADQTRIDVEIEADKDAAVGDQKTGVVAEGPKAAGSPQAQGDILVTVKRYEPPPKPIVDILFLLDVTGSMQFAINGVRDGILNFAKDLQEQRLDARLGLIAFRDRQIGEEPEILAFGDKNEVFTADTPAFRAKVGLLRAGGGGDEPESSPDAVVLGCRQEFRRKATKVIVLITDASPKLPDKDTPTMEAAAKVVKESGIDQLHLVIHRQHRRIYEKLGHPMMGGQWFDLQKAASGAEGFAKIMPEVSKEIARTTVVSAAPKAPPEKAKLAPPPVARQAADIAPTPEPPVLKGVTSTEDYAAGSTGQLLLAISAWTAVIAAGVCLLLIVGQNLYLRQAWGPVATHLKGFGGGLLAGVVGGAAGQLLFQLGAGGALVEIVFRIIGWTILGALAGVGMAFFIPNLRTSKGLLGGALGGAVGAAGFILVAMLLRGTAAGDIAARLLGATLLGLCIGLMVAAAERMFRSAWLEIDFGECVVRVVNLGPEPVSIGSDSRQCTIFARQAAPLAYRYWMRDGKLIQLDAVSGKETELRGGEVQKVGAAQVSVFTAATQSAEKKSPGASAPSTPRIAAPPTTNTVARAPAPPPPKPAPAAKVAAPPPPPPASGSKPPPSPVSGSKPPPPPSGSSSKPPPPPAAAPKPSVPTARPAPKPSGPPPKPTGAPAAKAVDAGACPTCGRKVPGQPGKRYCLTCDETF